MYNTSVFTSLDSYYSTLSGLGYVKYKEVSLMLLMVDFVDMVDNLHFTDVFTDHPEYLSAIDASLSIVEHSSEIIDIQRSSNVERPIM